jgi:hypothetical protein
MNRFALHLVIAVSSLAAAAATAQTPSTPSAPTPAAVPPGASATTAPAPVPAAQWTTEKIRQAFDLADSDSDGQLSRAEAQRLTILPRSFEDLDQNKDGMLSRSEYEAGFTR